MFITDTPFSAIFAAKHAMEVSIKLSKIFQFLPQMISLVGKGGVANTNDVEGVYSPILEKAYALCPYTNESSLELNSFIFLNQGRRIFRPKNMDFCGH